MCFGLIPAAMIKIIFVLFFQHDSAEINALNSAEIVRLSVNNIISCFFFLLMFIDISMTIPKFV